MAGWALRINSHLLRWSRHVNSCKYKATTVKIGIWCWNSFCHNFMSCKERCCSAYNPTFLFLCAPILSPYFSYLLINDKSFCRSLRNVIRLQKSLSFAWPNDDVFDDLVPFSSGHFYFHIFSWSRAMEHTSFDHEVDLDTIARHENVFNDTLSSLY